MHLIYGDMRVLSSGANPNRGRSLVIPAKVNDDE
jgi:hypothetical protein